MEKMLMEKKMETLLSKVSSQDKKTMISRYFFLHEIRKVKWMKTEVYSKFQVTKQKNQMHRFWYVKLLSEWDTEDTKDVDCKIVQGLSNRAKESDAQTLISKSFLRIESDA